MSSIDFNTLAAALERSLSFLDPVTDGLLSHLPAAPAEGRSVLDIGTGTGEPGLSLARQEQGTRLLGIDSSVAMVDLARGKASAAQLSGVTFEVMDAQMLDLPDNSVDVVVSRLAALSFGDPELGAREAVRVLRPGGALSIAVWDATSKNIISYATLSALGEHLPRNIRALFESLEQFAMPQRRERWLHDAGLLAVDSELFAWNADFTDEQTLWDFATGPGLFQQSFAGLPAEELPSVRATFDRLLAEYRHQDGSYRLPYECRLIWGRR